MKKIIQRRNSKPDPYDSIFDQQSFNEIFEKDKQEIISSLINKQKSNTFCKNLRIEGKEFKIITFNDNIRWITISSLLEDNSKPTNVSLFLKKILKIKLYEGENLTLKESRSLWLVASGARQRMNENPSYYKDLLTQFSESSSHFIHPIDLDIKRTWPRVECLAVKDKEAAQDRNLEQSRNILLAYSRRNPYIGYCQGMNFIVSDILLHGLEEEEVFWLLCQNIECILPIDYYSTMGGLLADQRIFSDLINYFFPDISGVFKNCNLDCSLFAVQWFVCLFTKTLPPKIVRVVLDFFFVEGRKAIFRAGLALLDFLKADLINLKEFPDVLRVLEEKTKLIDCPGTFQEHMKRFYISNKILKVLSEKYRQESKKELNTKIFEQHVKGKRGRQRRKRWLEQISKCDSNDQVCLGVIEENKLLKRSASYFVFRQAETTVKIIQDYYYNPFEDRNMRNKKGMSLNRNLLPVNGLQDYLINNKAMTDQYIINVAPVEQGILIGRMHHSCDEFRKERAEKIADIAQGHEAKNLSMVLDSNTLSTYKNQEFLRNLISESINDAKEAVAMKKTSPDTTTRVSDKKVQPPITSVKEKTPKTFLKSSEKSSVFSNFFHIPFAINGKELKKGERTLRKTKGSFEVGDIADSRATTIKKTFKSACSDTQSQGDDEGDVLRVNFIDSNDRMEKTDDEEVHVIIDTLEDASEKSEKEESFEIRESMCIMKSKGIFPNMTSDLYDKYKNELACSSGFSFNSELFYGPSLCK